MKLYIHYDDAWWVNDLNLTAGPFQNTDRSRVPGSWGWQGFFSCRSAFGAIAAAEGVPSALCVCVCVCVFASCLVIGHVLLLTLVPLAIHAPRFMLLTLISSARSPSVIPLPSSQTVTKQIRTLFPLLDQPLLVLRVSSTWLGCCYMLLPVLWGVDRVPTSIQCRSLSIVHSRGDGWSKICFSPLFAIQAS